MRLLGSLVALSLVGLLAALATPAPADPLLNHPAPDITGERWINSPPLTMGALRGRVVLVEFWTYG